MDAATFSGEGVEAGSGAEVGADAMLPLVGDPKGSDVAIESTKEPSELESSFCFFVFCTDGVTSGGVRLNDARAGFRADGGTSGGGTFNDADRKDSEVLAMASTKDCGSGSNFFFFAFCTDGVTSGGARFNEARAGFNNDVACTWASLRGPTGAWTKCSSQSSLHFRESMNF